MKQIHFSEVVKVTSCKVPLEPADVQALEKQYITQLHILIQHTILLSIHSLSVHASY